MAGLNVVPLVDEGLGNSAYLVLGVFTAGSLLVGSAWPTHGAGSFCSAPPGTARTTTIGAERAGNNLLRAESEDAFVEQLLSSLGSYPPYFRRLGEVNRRGPALLTGDTLTGLTAAEVARLRASGAEVIEEILWQARKVGYDRIAGELAGGIDAWTAAGEPVAVIPVAGVEELDGVRVLDIRQDTEYDAGHVPGAEHIELGALAARAADLPDEPLVVMCGHGERAMGAASLLARAGHDKVTVFEGGPRDWADKSRRSLETGR